MVIRRCTIWLPRRWGMGRCISCCLLSRWWNFWHGMIYVLLLAGRMLVRERVWLFPYVSVRAFGMLGHEKTQELLPFLDVGRWDLSRLVGTGIGGEAVRLFPFSGMIERAMLDWVLMLVSEFVCFAVV